MQPNLTAAETALGMSLPTRRDEAWKWTDVRGHVNAKSGGLTRICVPQFDAPKGVVIAEIKDNDLVADTPMAALARNFGGQVWDISVADDQDIAETLVISDLISGHARVRLTVGKGARLSMVEHYSGAKGGFSNLDLTVVLKAGAHLSRTVLHDDPADHVRVVTTHITAWEDAKLTQHTLSFGASLGRLETRLAAMSKAVEADIHGAYLLSDKRHTDMTSYIDLAAPDCTIRQSVKGVATDTARGVFQGKFHVRRPAQHTDAEMRHDALMLSDNAEIRAKPELEIYADDVACAHGNTLGALDESALFYMRQRGIPLADARALLTEAFVADVFDDMADEDLRDTLLTKVRQWLGTTP